MTDVPRRAEPSGADKVAVIADRAAPGSLAGNTQWHRPQGAKQPTPQNSFGDVIVGDTTGAGGDAVAITSTTGDGAGSTASADGAVAVGRGSLASGATAIAIGSDRSPDPGPVASGGDSIAIGRKSQAGPVSEAIAIGHTARSLGSSTVAVGAGATADGGADPSNLGATALGPASTASGTDNLALGAATIASGEWGNVACGAEAEAHGVASIAIGRMAKAGTSGTPVTNSVAIGDGATVTGDNQFILGTGGQVVIINGVLVIPDTTGGYVEVQSTAGVLSTHPWP